MKMIYKIYALILITFSNFLLADTPQMPVPGDGGGGSTGPGGAPENPIDMYLVWLALAAVVTIFYFVKKQKKQLA